MSVKIVLNEERSRLFIECLMPEIERIAKERKKQKREMEEKQKEKEANAS